MAYPNTYGYYPTNFYSQNGAMPDALNQYKTPYQQPQIPPQMMQAQQSQPPQPSNDIIWVQGEAGAKAYLVAPNTTITLWDSENRTIYVKSADASGIPSMRILDWTERINETQNKPKAHECQCGNDFVRTDEFKALERKLEALSSQVESLMEQPKEEKENE